MDSNLEELIIELSKHISYKDIVLAKIEAHIAFWLFRIKLAIKQTI